MLSGAAVRGVVQVVQERQGQERQRAAREPLGRSCALGGVAGAVAGMLFITAQLVAVSPEVQPAVWAKQAGRLVPFAVLIGFVAGMTLDAVFRKLGGVDVVRTDMLEGGLGRVQGQQREARP